MFLTTRKARYNRKGEQTRAGLFLLLFCQESGGELRAIVRYARLRQWGHWLMGTVAVGSERIALSGAYGEDGLPISDRQQTKRLWTRLHSVPPDLQQAFWQGGGHNGAGSESPEL